METDNDQKDQNFSLWRDYEITENCNVFNSHTELILQTHLHLQQNTLFLTKLLKEKKELDKENLEDESEKESNESRIR